MTVERKVTVGLGDIKAVIFQCRNCPTRVAVQPDNIRIPRQCSQCGQQWTPEIMESVSSPKVAALKFCAALSQCRAVQDNGAAFTILLEFDAPEFQEKS